MMLNIYCIKNLIMAVSCRDVIRLSDILWFLFVLLGAITFIFGIYGMVNTNLKSTKYIVLTVAGLVILALVYGVDIYMGYKKKNHSSLLDTLPVIRCLTV